MKEKVSDFYGVETPHSLSAVENALAPSASHSNFWRFGGFISEFWNCALQLQGHTISYCGISFTELLSVSPTNAPTFHLVMGSPVNQIPTFKATFFFPYPPISQPWHLSSCLSGKEAAAVFRMFPTPPPLYPPQGTHGRWRGWLVICLSRNQVKRFSYRFGLSKIDEGKWSAVVLWL